MRRPSFARMSILPSMGVVARNAIATDPVGRRCLLALYGRLGSWDRTLLPYPFARGRFICGEPVFVPRDADADEQERLRLFIESEVDRLTDLADSRVGLGLEDVRPPVEA